MVHSLGCTRNDSSTSTKNIVEPYISIRSPGCRTPAENASAQASTVPGETGVPAGIPVSAAAASVTVPITSCGQTSRGISSSPATSGTQSCAQSKARTS